MRDDVEHFQAKTRLGSRKLPAGGGAWTKAGLFRVGSGKSNHLRHSLSLRITVMGQDWPVRALLSIAHDFFFYIPLGAADFSLTY